MIHLDYETFSEADLKKVGAWRYAFDPSTEILCMALAEEDEEPVVWRADNKWKSPQELIRFQEMMEQIQDGSTLIYAHNAGFEIAITEALWQRTFNKPKPLHTQWRCTAAMARRAALPASLAKIAAVLKLEQQKDTKGAGLIRLFSVMQKPRKVKGVVNGVEHRVLPQHQPDKFNDFIEYCRQDVRTERAVHKELKAFELTGFPLATFQLDIAINARGVPVNLHGLQCAQRLVDQVVAESAAEFRAITGFEVTQVAALLAWLQARGYKGTTLRAQDVEDELEEPDDDEAGTEGLSPEGVRALTLRRNTSFAATKKIAAMLRCAGPHDNRVRGSIIYHGPTTGRWSGALIQPQNFKRPTPEMAPHTEAAYRDICEGRGAEYLRLCYGEPLDVLSSCIRHFIHDITPNRLFPVDRWVAGKDEVPMLDADYAAIEARIVCWLAGEEEALREYRAGVDRYVRMASVIFNKPEAIITKDQRFIGKQAVLACGFQTSANGFIRACANFGVEANVALAEQAVTAFRQRHKKLVNLWYATEGACRQAVNSVNTKFRIGEHCLCFCAVTAGMKFLFIRLPSGRHLAYPDIKIAGPNDVERRTKKGVPYDYPLPAGGLHFFGQLRSSQQWGRVETYGGSLVENITQAVAADVMANGALNAEAAGYEIATLIHDEALAYLKPGQSIDEFVKLLTTLPAWANGLPVVAEGEVVPFYKK